jgi:pimeloyl-ACP methyl ester carboxylesterase
MFTVRTDDGVTIAYRTLGTGPRTLFFLHGWGGSGTGPFWDEMLKYLDLSGLRLILADLRGHGASDKVETGFTFERFARDMFAVADEVEANNLILVGYSMSGKWTQWMSCSEPDRVKGQILIAPIPALAIPFPDEVKQYWLNMAESRNMDMFKEWISQFIKDPFRPEILEGYFNDVTQTPQFSLSESLTMCTQGAFVDKLEATQAATLVIGGSHDSMLTADFLRQAIVSAIPGARLAMLDCGHEIPLEQPQETAALIEAFLAGL